MMSCEGKWSGKFNKYETFFWVGGEWNINSEKIDLQFKLLAVSQYCIMTSSAVVTMSGRCGQIEQHINSQILQMSLVGE